MGIYSFGMPKHFNKLTENQQRLDVRHPIRAENHHPSASPIAIRLFLPV
jgi:hypothetical protein